MARKKRTSKEENQLAKTKSAKIKSAKTRKFSREQVNKREDILAAETEESALETLASQVRALSARPKLFSESAATTACLAMKYSSANPNCSKFPRLCELIHGGKVLQATWPR